MHILEGKSQTISNQTINEPIHNDGHLTLINCVVNGNITGKGTLNIKGSCTTNGDITQGNINIG
jgi:hypothetical protein